MRHNKWHIHIGAHKTATTHIQKELQARQGELLSGGICYPSLEETRAMLQFREVQRPFWWRVMQKRFRDYIPSPFISKNFAKECSRVLINEIIDRMEGHEFERVILSDENILGTTDEVFRGSYFEKPVNLPLLFYLSECADIEIFICVRSLDTFLPSAYAQALRAFPANELRFGETVKRFVQGDEKGKWSSLILNIKRVLPNVKIKVWNYDDYAANARIVQSLIAGCDLSGLPEIPRPQSTRSPSATAIEVAERLEEREPKKRVALVNEIYRMHSDSSGKGGFTPFSDNIRSKFKSDFEVDLSRIAMADGVDLLDF